MKAGYIHTHTHTLLGTIKTNQQRKLQQTTIMALGTLQDYTVLKEEYPSKSCLYHVFYFSVQSKQQYLTGITLSGINVACTPTLLYRHMFEAGDFRGDMEFCGFIGAVNST